MLYAGGAKFASPTATENAVRVLVPRLTRTRGIVYALATAELLCGLSLAIRPGPASGTLLFFLGSCFAAAGLRAISTGKVIACGCFGIPTTSTLGRNQLLLLLLWLPVGYAAISTQAPWKLEQGLLRADLVAAVATITAVARLTPKFMESWYLRRALGT